MISGKKWWMQCDILLSTIYNKLVLTTCGLISAIVLLLLPFMCCLWFRLAQVHQQVKITNCLRCNTLYWNLIVGWGTMSGTSFIIVGSCTMSSIWLIDLLCVGSMIKPGLFNHGDFVHVSGSIIKLGWWLRVRCMFINMSCLCIVLVYWVIVCLFIFYMLWARLWSYCYTIILMYWYYTCPFFIYYNTIQVIATQSHMWIPCSLNPRARCYFQVVVDLYFLCSSPLELSLLLFWGCIPVIYTV